MCLDPSCIVPLLHIALPPATYDSTPLTPPLLHPTHPHPHTRAIMPPDDAPRLGGYSRFELELEVRRAPCFCFFFFFFFFFFPPPC